MRRELRNFSPYLRFIDDLAHEFPDIPSKDDYYGMDIVCTGSAPPAESVDLLSYNFRVTPEFLRVAFKNKQKGFPILLIRYPSHFSTITESCRIGCVVAGLVSIYRVIDSPLLFADAVRELFGAFALRRFTYMMVLSGVRKFLSRNCRKEYHGFLIAHFFADILSQWPYRNDVPASRIVEEERLRRSILHHDPLHQQSTVPSFVLPTPQTQQNPDRHQVAASVVSQSLTRLNTRPLAAHLHQFVPPLGFQPVTAMPSRRPLPPEPSEDSDSDDDRFFDCIESL